MKILKEDNKLKLQVSDEEVYDLHYSFRIHIIFEAVANKNLELDKLDTVGDWFLILHATVISTLQYNKSSAKVDYDELMNIVDDCGNDQLMIDFMGWFLKQLGIEENMIPKTEEEKKSQMKK